jgi:LacI family transcriptional regulator
MLKNKTNNHRRTVVSKATIDDVARRAGVSIKTVSRVLNREPNVRDVTRQRVLNAVERLSYRPNPSARSLAGKRSYLIGLIYDDPGLYEDPSSNYIINIQLGVLRVCKPLNYELLIYPCDYRTPKLTKEIVALISHSQLDGVILTPPLSDLTELLEAIRKTNTPVVRISPGARDNLEPAIYTSDRESCAEMTAYLASLGHNRIAFITGHPDHKALEGRYLGYRDGLKQAGLKFDKALVKKGDNSFAAGERAARELLASGQPPSAIFACNDDMAAGVMRVAHEMGIRVPGELSIAGFDDIAPAKMLYPALTTIRQPIAKMAERAAEILLASIRSSEPQQHDAMVAATLNVRESTAPPKVCNGTKRQGGRAG